MTADTLVSLMERLTPDSGLDDHAVRLCRNVIARALDGHTLDQITGYMGYRRRIARPGAEKEAARRVARALRTNRWGLRDVIVKAQQVAEEIRRRKAIEREARRIYYEQLAGAKALVPENKRRRGSGGRKGRKGARNKNKKAYRRRVWAE